MWNCLKHLSITDLSFAETYSNLGTAYSIEAEYKKSLSYYEKALEIFLKSPKLNIRSIATCYNNIKRESARRPPYSSDITSPKKFFFSIFFVSNDRPRLTIAKSKILSRLILPMENGNKNKFKRSILTLKIIILRVWSVFWHFLTNGSTVWARKRLIL